MTEKYGIIRLTKAKIINCSYEFCLLPVAIATGTAKKGALNIFCFLSI